jgi:uncharacterized protein (DUF2164 family)
MNTNIVEKRYNYVVRSTLGATGNFSQTINCNFIPDEMIVRGISYYNNGAEASISYVSQNITPLNDIISAIGDGLVLSLQSAYTLNKPVNGLYIFTIIDVNGNIVITRAGILTIVLEFVKYKDQKQEKIY